MQLASFPRSHEARRTNGHGWLSLGLGTAAMLVPGAVASFGPHRHRKNQLAFAAAGFVAGATVIALRSLARGAAAHAPIELVASITVNRSPEDVYRFWRDFRNLSTFMRHLDEVDEFEGTSVWTARGPTGVELTWDAEIVADRPNERLAWRSLEGATIANHGSVEFKPGPAGRGTEVHVVFGFEPPLGPIGAALAKLLGEIPEQELRQDLRRFKQVMETGELMHSDASVHRGPHPARPPQADELPLVKGLVHS